MLKEVLLSLEFDTARFWGFKMDGWLPTHAREARLRLRFGKTLKST